MPRSSLRTLDAEHTNIAISNPSDGFFTEIQRLQINRARSLHKAGNILRTNSPMLKNYTLVSTYKPEDWSFSDDDAQSIAYLVPTKVITTL